MDGFCGLHRQTSIVPLAHTGQGIHMAGPSTRNQAHGRTIQPTGLHMINTFPIQPHSSRPTNPSANMNIQSGRSPGDTHTAPSSATTRSPRTSGLLPRRRELDAAADKVPSNKL